MTRDLLYDRIIFRGIFPREVHIVNSIYKKFLAVLLSFGLAFNTAVPIFAEEQGSGETAVTVETEDTEAEAADAAEEPTYSYSLSGAGDIVSASYEHLGAAATMYKYTCKTGGALTQTVYAATVDLSRGGAVRGVSLGTRLGSRTGVSALEHESEDEKLLLAVNADFFSTVTGVPMGVFMENGRFVSSSDNNAAIGFDEEGNAFIGYVGDSILLSQGNDDYAISYLNKYPTVYGSYLLTRDFGKTTYISASLPSTEYIMELESDIVFGDRVRGKVIEIRTGVSNGEIPEDCAVLVVPDAYQHSSLYREIEEGDRVYIKAECNELFENAVNAVGGGDILLEDGEVREGLDGTELGAARHPRTAAGVTADGKIVLAVVDGRQSGYSNGLKMSALAELMKSLGAISAINLDGGGSSTFVIFGEEGGRVVNKPSDKTERKVPSALAAFADIEKVSGLHTLDARVEFSTVLSGSRLPITLTLTNAEGETEAFIPTEENLTVTVDSLFGSCEIEDGKLYFVAGNEEAYGNVHISAEVDGESLFADVYMSVVTDIDTFTADETLLIAETDGEMSFKVNAEKNGEKVHIGGAVGVMCENERFIVSADGENITLSLILPEADTEVTETTEVTDDTEVADDTEVSEDTEPDETTEVTDDTEVTTPEEPAERPEAAQGRVGVWVLDKTVIIPAFFDNNLYLSLDSLLSDGISLSDESLGISYSESGGVTSKGAFIIEAIPEVTEETEETEESLAEVAETTDVVETTEPAETTEIAETTEPAEVDESTETTEPDEVDTVAKEPTEYTVTVSSDAIVSRGLSGKRLWLWVDGLDISANPYAVFTVTDKDGNVRKESVYYEMFYDFVDFNGRTLLTLAFEYGEGETASLTSPLVYTTLDKERSVSFGPFVIAEELDTNLYADTAEHWSEYYVNSLSYMGIVNGSELDGEPVFRPDDMLSREQFAKILVNFLKIDLESYSETELAFEDTEKISEWAIPFVRAAVGAGLMRGRSTVYDTILFAPNEPITREEAFYVLGGLLQSEGESETEFTDGGDIAPWALENLEKLFCAGLVSGYDDGSVRPRGNITRAEAATVVVRLYDLVSNG